MGRAGPRGLVAAAAEPACARCPRARSVSPGRCTDSSSSTPTARSCARRSSGTTSARRRSATRSSADRARAPDRAHRQPRATGFTAPKLLWLREHEPETYARIRHILLPKDYVRFRLTGERAIDVADASGTLLFDVAARRWSEEVCAALEIPLEWLPPVLESTEIGAAPATRPRLRWGSGSSRPDPSRSCSAPRASSSPSLPAYAATRGARPRLLPRRARHLARDGGHAQRRRLARLAAHVLGGDYESSTPRRALAARQRRAAVRALPRGRAHAARRSGRARRVRRAVAPPRSRRARPRDARGGRLRAARLPRAPARARRRAARRPRLRRRGAAASSGCGSSPRCSGSRSSAPRREEGSAFGAALLAGVRAGVFADVEEAVARCVRVRDRIEPDPDWVASLRARIRHLPRALPGAPAAAAALDG